MAHCVFVDRHHFIITGQHKRHRTSAVGFLDREWWVIHQWSVCKVLTNNSLFFGRIGLCWWGTGDVGFIVGLKLGQGVFPKCLGLEWDLINNLAAQFRVDIPGWWWSADPGSTLQARTLPCILLMLVVVEPSNGMTLLFSVLGVPTAFPLVWDLQVCGAINEIDNKTAKKSGKWWG